MYDEILEKLSHSKFRNSFKLKEKDRLYIQQKGLETIKAHAKDFISKRLAPSFIKNDGKQTPTKGHPVFIAQHATAACCRKCLNKWHHFPQDTELNTSQQDYIVGLILEWIKRQL